MSAHECTWIWKCTRKYHEAARAQTMWPIFLMQLIAFNSLKVTTKNVLAFKPTHRSIWDRNLWNSKMKMWKKQFCFGWKYIVPILRYELKAFTWCCREEETKNGFGVNVLSIDDVIEKQFGCVFFGLFFSPPHICDNIHLFRFGFVKLLVPLLGSSIIFFSFALAAFIHTWCSTTSFVS